MFLAALLGGSADSVAGNQTSVVVITSSIFPSCTIGTAAIAFAAYDPVNANAAVPNDQTGDIVISCTKGITGITIDLGNGANNDGRQRRMVNSTGHNTFLNYEVYQDMTRSTVWGRGDDGSVRSGVDLDGTGSDVHVTMYGRIPAAQTSAIPGGYNDTLVSTINF
jgi:spore coat protein U-like protein